MNTVPNTVPAYEVKIFIAGDLAAIRQCCREFCMRGACVTVTPTEFIYTGASETGAIVGLIHYARFPISGSLGIGDISLRIDADAAVLAEQLLQDACQRSCTVQTPSHSYFLTHPNMTHDRIHQTTH